ncbi:metal ABC transporter permease [Myxococcota bacterium]|nr:metal ABC transporter permease [Myxococcota bacterium]
MSPELAPSWAEFVEGLPIFRDAIAAAVIAGFVLGFLGVFVVLRRVVFATAAISQSAGLGVALAFYAQIHGGLDVPPVVGALVTSLAATLIIVLPRTGPRLSRESILGAVFIAAGGFAVIIGDRIAQEAHDITAILFGTAVLVRPEDFTSVAIVGTLVTLVHVAFHRGFVFAAYDAESARVQHVPVRLLEGVHWVLFALAVSVATRALGVVPVFAFSVLPAMAALVFGARVERTLVLAAALGAVAGGVGYVIAYFAALPVGGAQAAVAVALFLGALALHAALFRR